MRVRSPRGGQWLSALALGTAFLSSACAEQALPAYAAGQATAAPAYKLGPGDKVRIDTFGEQALSGEFDVSGTGDLALPLIGVVPARGRTTEELAASIQQRLSEGGYLRNPKVAAQVLNYRPFFILGEVMKPGAYPFSTGMTVLNAVATAQGFTYRANKARVFVRHADQSAEQAEALTAATPVLPGDTIRIAERHF